MATVNLDTAARLGVVCRKGDSFQLVLDFGVAIPASTWKLDVLTKSEGGSSILADTVFSYTRGDGDATNSKLTIEATATEMNVTAGLYVYDLQVEDSGTQIDGANQVKTYLFGTFKVVDDISS